MTEKQLERAQEIIQEIKYLGELMHRWEIDISKLKEKVLSNLKNRIKELQDEFNNL